MASTFIENEPRVVLVLGGYTPSSAHKLQVRETLIMRGLHAEPRGDADLTDVGQAERVLPIGEQKRGDVGQSGRNHHHRERDRENI